MTYALEIKPELYDEGEQLWLSKDGIDLCEIRLADGIEIDAIETIVETLNSVAV